MRKTTRLRTCQRGSATTTSSLGPRRRIPLSSSTPPTPPPPPLQPPVHHHHHCRTAVSSRLQTWRTPTFILLRRCQRRSGEAAAAAGVQWCADFPFRPFLAQRPTMSPTGGLLLPTPPRDFKEPPSPRLFLLHPATRHLLRGVRRSLVFRKTSLTVRVLRPRK